ncbi:hypothetical protein NDU88_000649, partial [Pleurodeles waltl]
EVCGVFLCFRCRLGLPPLPPSLTSALLAPGWSGFHGLVRLRWTRLHRICDCPAGVPPPSQLNFCT